MSTNYVKNMSVYLAPFLIGTLLSISVSACATTEKKDPAVEGAALPSQEHMEEGKPTLSTLLKPKDTPTLPDYYPIFAATKGEKPKSDDVFYRGWDFNGDGKIDMIDVLSEKKVVIERHYDFDLDGVLDKKEIP